MGKIHDQIDDRLRAWIDDQHLFFVATAPLDGEGLVNLSPKGLDTFAVLDPHTVAYLDLTGSGVETIAHLKENGRIVVMFCAFTGPAKIVRLHGTGRVIEPHDAKFAQVKRHFPDLPGVRSIITVEVSRISDSCGYGVPRYEYEGERDTLVRYAEHLGAAGIADYQAENNLNSLDGLTGLSDPVAQDRVTQDR